MSGADVPAQAGSVIAYVDGTPSGDEAVTWAIEEAGRRNAVVRVLPRRDPDRLLAETADAALIVVGSTGFLAMSDLAAGSTAMEVAVRADVPVVVVRPGLPGTASGPSAGRVVVGVDGTGLSEAAIGFAAAEADDRGCGLTLVHAMEREEHRGVAEAMLARVAAARRDVRTVARVGMASVVLIEESAGAELLAVGSRGRAGLSGMLLGSVSQAVVHRAYCPVAVVRAPVD
ncbi:universal stress protein [Actinoallomurus sp. NPDC050550]|uniref:universal stress protein n=1 Tax=Actinoallomurus sp. NPDC050550 TaxID=3154937 RepID=UPI0033EBC16D